MKSAARKHVGFAVLIVVAFTGVLLATSGGLGYARDEGFYFQAAASYEQWFRMLLSDPGRALQQDAVDRYWQVNHEHPALMKSLFALSHHFLYEQWGIFATPGGAYRFPAMLLSALGVGLIYLWGTETLGALAALTAAVLFAAMPRVFYHSHLACFDMPVATLWLLTAYAYWHSLRRRSVAGALGVGILYGLFLNTKHNSWIFPFALAGHLLILNHRALLERLWPFGRTSGKQHWELRVPPALLGMLLLAPLTFYLTWPWIWSETLPRLRAYAAFHLGHEYYNMEFLGRTYWKPPMPLGYAWGMTIATVPGITLALFLLGLASFVQNRFVPRALSWAAVLRLSTRVSRLPLGSVSSAYLLWLCCLLLSYAPWWFSTTPIFGGTKHWLGAYPFLCLFAGLGVRVVYQRALRVAASQAQRRAAGVLTLVCILGGPVVMTWNSHPWGLSAYTPIVGGASGAANLGLNRTFWGYTSAALFSAIDAHAPPSARVYVHDTALQSWHMHAQNGDIRADLRGTLDIANSELALYHHEAHMQRVEYQIWSLYGTARPKEVRLHDGVPVVWLYQRP